MSHDPELDALLRDLPDELPPVRDLWPEVRDRIAPPRARRSAVLPIAAGAVLLLATASWLDGSPTVEPAGTPSGIGTLHPVMAWEAEVRASTEALSDAVASADAGLDPEQQRVIDANLRQIDQALTEIRAAMRDHPDDPDLGEQLTSMYDRRIALLQSAARLSEHPR